MHAPVSELKGQKLHHVQPFTPLSVSLTKLQSLFWRTSSGTLADSEGWLTVLNLATWPPLAGGWPEIEWQGWPWRTTLLFWEKVVYDLTHAFRMN